MAFSLKKWITGQMESARLNDANDNWTAIEGAIDTLQTNASLLPIQGTVEGSIITYAENLTRCGAYIVAVHSGITTDVPSAYYQNMPGIILRRYAARVIVLFNYSTGQLAVNARYTSGWSGWNIIG